MADTATFDDTGDATGDIVDINSAVADQISGLIDAGSTITYDATLENLVVESGGGADSYTIAPDANTAIDVEANNPITLVTGDLLVLDLTSVTNPSLNLTGLFSGTLTSTFQTVTFGEFEQLDTLDLPNQGLDLVLNMSTLGFQNGVADTIDLQRGLNGADFTVEVRINGVLVLDLEEQSLDSIRFIGSTDNETLTFTETANGIISLTGATQGTDGVESGNNNPNIVGNPDLQFDGNAGNDAIVYNFTAGGTLYDQTYAVGDGVGGGSGVGSSHGEILTQINGGGAANRIYFTGLEPISSSAAGGTLTIVGDTNANTIEVLDSPIAGFTRVQATTPAFEFFDFAANAFTTLQVFGHDAGDTIDVQSFDALEASLTSLVLDGRTDVGGDDNAADTIRLRTNTRPGDGVGISTQMFGGGGDDTFDIFDGANSVDQILGAVTVDGGNGEKRTGIR